MCLSRVYLYNLRASFEVKTFKVAVAVGVCRQEKEPHGKFRVDTKVVHNPQRNVTCKVESQVSRSPGMLKLRHEMHHN